jgi:prepilin-type processing-associated H-X9-DG protein
VQKVREAASRARCGDHLRQIGLGLHTHHDTHRLFPSNGGWDGRQRIRSRSGADFTPFTHEDGIDPPFYWGVGDPALGPRDQQGSWAYALLPYVEQVALFRDRAWGIPITIYVCPSRRKAVASVPVADQYGTYEGGGWEWAKTDYAVNGWLIRNRPHCARLSSVTDGTSSTILAGEKSMHPANYQSGTWYWDEPFFLGGSMGTQRDGRFVLRDSPNMGRKFRYNWGSAHVGGAPFLFADGSVRSLHYDIDPLTMRALLTPNGGDVVSDR